MSALRLCNPPALQLGTWCLMWPAIGKRSMLCFQRNLMSIPIESIQSPKRFLLYSVANIRISSLTAKQFRGFLQGGGGKSTVRTHGHCGVIAGPLRRNRPAIPPFFSGVYAVMKNGLSPHAMSAPRRFIFQTCGYRHGSHRFSWMLRKAFLTDSTDFADTSQGYFSQIPQISQMPITAQHL